MKQITGRDNIAGLISSNVLISPYLTYAKSRFLAKIICSHIAESAQYRRMCQNGRIFWPKNIRWYCPPCIILFIKYHNKGPQNLCLVMFQNIRRLYLFAWFERQQLHLNRTAKHLLIKDFFIFFIAWQFIANNYLKLFLH